MSYTEETYTALDGAKLVTYEFSDGDVFTALTAGRRTTVTRQAFRGDADHRSSRKELNTKLDGQTCTGITVIDGPNEINNVEPIRMWMN